jgi:hypothetical protein
MKGRVTLRVTSFDLPTAIARDSMAPREGAV